VTFLFTDIEGSTRRWEADGDAMRAAVLEHDEVLRDAIESHGGFLFSHTGDGVVAAFASPNSAVEAAVAAQRALELPVRMGLATGEAELRDGDYFGTVLNRAARVMAAGHGGQILVADGATSFLTFGVDWLVSRSCWRCHRRHCRRRAAHESIALRPTDQPSGRSRTKFEDPLHEIV
jgi:class 3 adenylate cyclase